MSDSSREERLSLELLADRTEVSPRQIRELIRLGVVPAPSSGGRGATYGAGHVERLKAWKRLREESPAGTTNEQLRNLLDQLQDSGLLAGIADGQLPITVVDDGQEDVTIAGVAHEGAATLASPTRSTGRRRTSPSLSDARNEGALDYLRTLGGGTRHPARVAMQPSDMRTTLQVDLGAGQRSGAGLVLARLRSALEDYVTAHAAGVRVSTSRSETWQRVAVGRDVEIVARGPLDPEEVELLETVAQLLQRAIYKRSQ